MILTTEKAEVFLCQKAVDFRYGFDRLASICKEAAGENPYSGNYFVFFNRSYTRAKVIFYDGSGCCLLWKRIEKGKFKPAFDASQGFATLGKAELTLLLEGVKYSDVKRPSKWQPPTDIAISS